jgi:hypothetical protein
MRFPLVLCSVSSSSSSYSELPLFLLSVAPGPSFMCCAVVSCMLPSIPWAMAFYVPIPAPLYAECWVLV